MPRTMEVSEPATTRMAIEKMISVCQDLARILSNVVEDPNER